MDKNKKIAIGATMATIGTMIGTTYIAGKKVYLHSVGLKPAIDKDKIEAYYKKSSNNNLEKLYKYSHSRVPLYCPENNYVIEIMNIKSSISTENTVILVHDLGDNYYDNLKLAFEYLQRGYNTILYNQRNTGRTGGSQFTFGLYEKFDLNEVVKYAKLEYPKGVLGVHGFSMGAATAALHSEINEEDKKVDFYILDGPYDTMKSAIRLGIKQNKFILKPYILWSGNIYTKVKDKFSFKDVQPKKALRKSTVPMMIIHGKEDNVTDYEGSVKMYNSINHNKKELWIVDNMGHCMAFYKLKDEYCSRIFNFLEKNIMHK